MARFMDRVLTFSFPGPDGMEIAGQAHYDVKVDSGRFGLTYEIDLGYVDWTLGGHPMYCMEGNEIPPVMRNKILAQITVTAEEMTDALRAEAEYHQEAA